MEKSEKKNQLQKKLFEEIQKRLPANHSLVDEIAEILNISVDSSYRLIRCDKILNIDEIYALCKHFHISFDILAGVRDIHQFDCTYRPIHLSVPDDYHKYFLPILQQIEKLKTTPDSSIFLSATDIPIFHLVSHKELTLFKIYTWFHSVYNYEGCLDGFVKEFGTPEIVAGFQKISNDYDLILSTEIWTENTVDTTLKLINYYVDICKFQGKDFPLLICEQVLNILHKLEKLAENSNKGTPATPFQLYVSEMELESTYLLMKCSGSTNCLVKLFTINSLNVFQKDFCIETEQWLTKLSQRSILLCGNSEKERIRFFYCLLPRTYNHPVHISRFTDSCQFN